MKVYSFPPVVSEKSLVLILGTMPGRASLQANEYYAHEQNAFWKILFLIFNQPFSKIYSEKTRLIINNSLSIWDTLKYCERPGSLDSSIKNEVPNDINGLLNIYPGIRHVIFNGKQAEKFYHKYNNKNDKITLHTMPSTSPANAKISNADKIARWSIIKTLTDINQP
ncbi:MAG: DNA-deoxyinosine glycosylase [Bacteroidales bacterium]